MKNLTKEDIFKIYLVMSKLNEIFHDSDRSSDQNIINKFVENYYPTINNLYYETLWNALTIQQRKELLGENFVEGIYDQDYFIPPENRLEEKDLMQLFNN